VCREKLVAIWQAADLGMSKAAIGRAFGVNRTTLKATLALPGDEFVPQDLGATDDQKCDAESLSNGF
jgi:hypothetical protein